MLKKTYAATAVAVAISWPSSFAFGQEAFFMPLGDLPGGVFSSRAYGVSRDGDVAVGSGDAHLPVFGSGNYDPNSFRRVMAAPMEQLCPGGDSDPADEAFGANGDGSVIVGWGNNIFGDLRARRWTQSSNLCSSLGDLPGGIDESRAFAVSGDGSVVVGFGHSDLGKQAFRWTAVTGMVGLDDLGGFESQASDVSVTGSFIVGYCKSFGNVKEACRWTFDGVPGGLGDLPGGIFDSEAFGVSDDGCVIVGQSTSGKGDEAFRWMCSAGMVPLGDLPGGSFSSRALAVSGDGSVVIGRATSDSGAEAFIWDENNGMRSLQSVLESLGIDLTGWAFKEATDVSADGLTIVGWGINPQNQTEAWKAFLGPGLPPACPWDFDGDGAVAVPDLLKLLAAWGPCP